ncbi:enoyl-CoA hydratase/isomerase family protein [Xanthobacter tagetidis]|jgi:enoyl-CoA hydratase/carnithine racemase|uniref:Enoyl-CoA hydratase/isomerase family protein n=1 Tax=Xanthobacter tagetidis TaxID=60216 RepID=A0A3L7A1Y0_9HYPH|nr:enoyl-CoA hydratase/isomerase family protein [Xanthobacter tagetidis]MBB6307191.1 enoyl-CoA hydratase/carnithine racemase [Xanthobacter tagetidis]RLP74030.1 enoyl-CoA hydratase/isomerase family protein [Xanthobacter tagetidis]
MRQNEKNVTSTVAVAVDGGIATLAIDRPEASNALDDAVRRDFTAALRALAADAAVAAVVLTGTGRSFCAGQDLREAAALDAARVPAWQAAQKAMFQSIRDLEKPCVAALNGAAAGAGFQVALCADIRVAHAGVRMGQPEVKAGIASIVGSYLMTLHLGLSRNVDLSLRGALIGGAEAQALGLVHELVAPEEVLPTARRIAREMADLPELAFRLSKRRFREMTQAGFDAACAAGARAQAECFAAGVPQRVLAARLAERAR